jgi:transposase
VPLAREALRQDVPPLQPVAGAQAAGDVAPEDPARPPRGRPEGSGALPKKGLRDALASAAAANPGKRLSLFFQDEARIGQKGRLCHRWWRRGERAPGRCDRRFAWTDIFAAVEPVSGRSFALVLPEATTPAMDLFLAEFGAALADDEHAVVALDQAGWHGAKALAVPHDITLVRLPPYSPRLNPVERVWLYLRERFLSLRVFADEDAILDACCSAWNRLAAEPGRLRSLCCWPWIAKVTP